MFNPISNRLRSVALNSLIRVDDVDLLIQLHEVAPKSNPDFLIRSRSVYEDGEYSVMVFSLDHIGSDFETTLIVKSFQGQSDFMLVSRPEFFTPDHRAVLQKSDNGWLFDGDGYPQEIYNDAESIVFKRKVACEIFSNIGSRPAAIVEWITESQIVNYSLILIETCIYNDGGGWVEFYEGRQIPNASIKL